MGDIRRKYRLQKNRKWYFSTTWKYLTSRYSNLKQVRDKYIILNLDGINHFVEAKSLFPHIHKDFRACKVNSPAAFVAILKKGRVYGKKAFILSSKYKLIQDISFEFNAAHLRPITKKKAYRKWNRHHFQYYPETIAALNFCSSNNYFHWMFDVLPRIELLRLSGLKIHRYVMNRRWIMPFQEETLAYLGITSEQIIDSRINIQAKKLIVPSLVNQYILKPHTYVKPSIIPKWSCDFLRNVYLHTNEPKYAIQNEYIYISRENAVYRKVINEEEIINHLAIFGFKKVILEYMTFAEQVRLFACAKVIVAPHGAGLANIVFCKPGTKVVELFSSKFMPAHYWMISNHVHLEYYYLVNQIQKSSHASSDFVVNIADLFEILQRACS